MTLIKTCTNCTYSEIRETGVICKVLNLFINFGHFCDSWKKKGQGISINVIIIAALALIVLAVIAIMFMGKMGVFSSESLKIMNYRP